MDINNIDLSRTRGVCSGRHARRARSEYRHDKINVNGGSIGDGSSAWRTGAHDPWNAARRAERQDKQFGLASLCVRRGMGIATIIERVQ